MLVGRVSLDSTFLGVLLVGASYQVINFTAVGGRKLRVLTSFDDGRGYACPNCGMIALRSRELPRSTRKQDRVKGKVWSKLLRKS